MLGTVLMVVYCVAIVALFGVLLALAFTPYPAHRDWFLD
ncbi:hypothetical protein HOU02_gp203 [Caulobacter phage CcrBL9]|uniref:Uncharacterized protein n=1 Tax=Caulobacter phage CcrBL9 TaxID=2283270 RepID=A0A385EF98_9CAUD|nr:hypothetical protein HOU02_gp203 [Caulobacter phage CcrBL9]AXQ69522.1 hypothetical protein CcrBL9_gp498 [Caulobacter phage CcrBL9]